MHDCSIATGDLWLSKNVSPLLSAVGPNGLVILTWDEDDGGAANHVLTVFDGRRVRKGHASARWMNHYTILRTICDALQLAPFGDALSDSAISDVWTSTPSDVPGASALGPFLGPPFPNPGRDAVVASLELPDERHVSAAIFDLAGRRVRDLGASLHSGRVDLRWDGRSSDGRRVSRGLYVLRVRAGDALLERKLTRVQ
jgi:hypothetical protein